MIAPWELNVCSYKRKTSFCPVGAKHNNYTLKGHSERSRGVAPGCNTIFLKTAVSFRHGHR